ncbi:MAG: NifU family protein [Endomicrobium sp.]|jgi:Fe-S cluster biogenesis protein NfuA|nr:NifU family protein [Endomicrobium sp.]
MILKEKVEKVLDDIKPNLQLDGGDVELIDITKENVIKVRLIGTCSKCPMANITLQHTVKEAIIKAIPDVKDVVAI